MRQWIRMSGLAVIRQRQMKSVSAGHSASDTCGPEFAVVVMRGKKWEAPQSLSMSYM